MAELQLKKAHRGRAFIKIGMSAPSGGGKTASSLLLAYGVVKEAQPDWSDKQIWAHIAIVDTENGSGELYVNSVINNTKTILQVPGAMAARPVKPWLGQPRQRAIMSGNQPRSHRTTPAPNGGGLNHR